MAANRRTAQISVMSSGRTDCDDDIPPASQLSRSFGSESWKAGFDKAFASRCKQLATCSSREGREKNSLKQAVRQRRPGSPRKRFAAFFFFVLFFKHMQCNVTTLFPKLTEICLCTLRPCFHESTVVMRTRLHHQIPSAQPLYSKLWQDYSYQAAPDLGSVPTLFIQLLNVCDANCDRVAFSSRFDTIGLFHLKDGGKRRKIVLIIRAVRQL